MNRIFRRPAPGFTGYAGLMLFAVAYLGVLAVVIAPDQLRPGAAIAPSAALASASD